MFMTENAINRDYAFNNCCVACYSAQAGQSNCDDKFCNCLVEAANGTRVCSRYEAKGFCLIVRQFGDVVRGVIAAFGLTPPNNWAATAMALKLEAAVR
uniref:CFEM domain-containing protein n=1 Tax=Globodera pallida TaxID=36090 RepID=A0A183CN78_GLOPA